MLCAKVFCLHALISIVSIVNAELTHQLESETFKTFENKVDFVESYDISNNATERRDKFCSAKPICITDGNRNSTDGLKPETGNTRMEDVNKLSGPRLSNSKSCKYEGCCMPMMFLGAAKKVRAKDYRNASEMLGHVQATSGSDEENSMVACSDIPKANDQNVHGLPIHPYEKKDRRNHNKSNERGDQLSTLRVTRNFVSFPYYRRTMTSAAEVPADKNMKERQEKAYNAIVQLYICMIISVTRCALVMLYNKLLEIIESAYQCEKDQIGG